LVRSWRRRTEENAVLQDLIALPGHVASAIISFDGGVVAAFVGVDFLDLNLVAVYVAAMLESSSRSVSAASLNIVNSLLLECEGGWMVARWLDEARHHLLLVLVDERGNPTLTRHSIKASAPLLQDWLSSRIEMDPPAFPQEASRTSSSGKPPVDEPERHFSSTHSSSSLQSHSPVIQDWNRKASEENPDDEDRDPSPDNVTSALNRLVK
jgi:predicted regulator of Ras-like GTPase activity (Roadblock/LC7/MglB family)